MIQGKRTDPFYQAQDILSRRDHTEFELRAKLKKKGFSPDKINSVVTWLQDRRLLDDQKFTERYIINTLQTKSVGPRWIAQKLRQKGIAPEVTEASLGAYLAFDRQAELAIQAANSWRRRHPQYKDDKQRLQRFLLSRGFSFEAISSVFTSFAAAESAPQPATQQ